MFWRTSKSFLILTELHIKLLIADGATNYGCWRVNSFDRIDILSWTQELREYFLRVAVDGNVVFPFSWGSLWSYCYSVWWDLYESFQCVRKYFLKHVTFLCDVNAKRRLYLRFRRSSTLWTRLGLVRVYKYLRTLNFRVDFKSR